MKLSRELSHMGRKPVEEIDTMQPALVYNLPRRDKDRGLVLLAQRHSRRVAPLREKHVRCEQHPSQTRKRGRVAPMPITKSHSTDTRGKPGKRAQFRLCGMREAPSPSVLSVGLSGNSQAGRRHFFYRVARRGACLPHPRCEGGTILFWRYEAPLFGLAIAAALRTLRRLRPSLYPRPFRPRSLRLSPTASRRPVFADN